MTNNFCIKKKIQCLHRYGVSKGLLDLSVDIAAFNVLQETSLLQEGILDGISHRKKMDKM